MPDVDTLQADVVNFPLNDQNDCFISDDPDTSDILETTHDLIRSHRLDEAAELVTASLARNSHLKDGQLEAVRLLLQHYQTIIANQAPFAHIGTTPLRPNDMFYACFDQFVHLIHQQQRQIAELQAILAELV